MRHCWALGWTVLMSRRVCEVRLFGQHKFEIKQQKYKISQELKEGQAKVLFGESSLPGSKAASCLLKLGVLPDVLRVWLINRLHCGLCRRLLD